MNERKYSRKTHWELTYGAYVVKNKKFRLASLYKPKGDQEKAFNQLVESVAGGNKYSLLKGVTGSGKTYTMARVIEALQRTTLVLAHNKTLAAQLYQEFKKFFPENAVEYFVSYYDYYQPEAYVPSTDTYVEKEVQINDDIDRLRYSATRSIIERRDCIIVASVSCIYGLGSPEAYYGMVLSLEKGNKINRRELLYKLVELQYTRNDYSPEIGNFRTRGDVIDVYPPFGESMIRIELFGDNIDSLSIVDPLTGKIINYIEKVQIYPRSHYIIPKAQWNKAVENIKDELEKYEAKLLLEGKLLEHQRIHERTMYDLEMIQELGYCRGIENYSRHLTGRAPGEPPPTLLDYLPPDYLMIIDESHVTIPQVRGMYNGDQSRKRTLVEHGFRLPSALDNRPLNFEEFQSRINQAVFVSATPGPYELERTGGRVIEQIIRPTGLLDPLVEIKPAMGQIDDLYSRIKARAEKGERVLVATLTKKMAEELTEYLIELGVKVAYMHSEIETLERVKIIRDLRIGVYDVLVGINLLREGLDLPEVSLVAILDADKEGFLRSTSSLIQTMGRAARNVNGTVILYASTMTKSMENAVNETTRRRKIQQRYNIEHGITPQSVIKPIEKELINICEADYVDLTDNIKIIQDFSSIEEINLEIKRLEKKMKDAAKAYEYEKAARFRDYAKELKERLLEYIENQSVS